MALVRYSAERSLKALPNLGIEARGQFQFSVTKITSTAMNKLRMDFDPSAYHNKYHAEDMIIGGKDLLVKMFGWSGGLLVSERQVDLYEAVAAAHDVFQASNLGKRRGRLLTPEQASAEWLLFQMAGENNRNSSGKPFAMQDWREAEEAILTTQVTYEGTAVQPRLTAAKSPITVALALYDINTAGLQDGSRRAVDATRKLFIEWKISPDVRKKLLSGSLTPEEEKPYIDNLISFIDTQITFNERRRDLLPGEIDSIGLLSQFPNVRAGLKFEFSHFDDSIAHLQRVRGDINSYLREHAELGTPVRFTELFVKLAPPSNYN